MYWTLIWWAHSLCTGWKKDWLGGRKEFLLFITVKFNFQGVSGEFLSLSDLQSCPQQESHLVCWLVARMALALLMDGDYRFRERVFSKPVFPVGKTPIPSLSLPLPGWMSNSRLGGSVVCRAHMLVSHVSVSYFCFLLSTNNMFPGTLSLVMWEEPPAKKHQGGFVSEFPVHLSS